MLVLSFALVHTNCILFTYYDHKLYCVLYVLCGKVRNILHKFTDFEFCLGAHYCILFTIVLCSLIITIDCIVSCVVHTGRKGKKYLASFLILNFALIHSIASYSLIMTTNCIVSYVLCGKARNILHKFTVFYFIFFLF